MYPMWTVQEGVSDWGDQVIWGGSYFFVWERQKSSFLKKWCSKWCSGIVIGIIEIIVVR